MQDDTNDIPRLPAEDVVDRSTDVPDVAHDDDRHQPGTDDVEDDDLMDEDDAEEGEDLDPKMTD